MTKFEEEVDKLAKQIGYESLSHLIFDDREANIIYTHFKNWHSDEEFQDMKAIGGSFALANQNLIDDNKKLVKEISDLKSKLQQQTLPVVPECVGEFITKVKKAGNNLTFAFNSKFDECPAKYWNEAIAWRLNHPEEFALAFITGNYQVEEPHLFYLRNKLTTSYLELDKTNDYFHHTMNPAPYYDMTRKSQFTQQEIDSMETGSYEKIEVTE